MLHTHSPSAVLWSCLSCCSVGLHTHTANMEVCYVLSGSGLVEDAQAGCTRLTPGDTHICLPGDTHKIVNDGTVPLVYLAAVLNP